jgi:hypothetical protein
VETGTAVKHLLPRVGEGCIEVILG